MKLRNLLTIVICVNFALTGVIAYKVFQDRNQPPVVAENPKPDDTGQITPIPESKESTFEEALASITSKELEEHLRYLASDELEGRMSGKKGNVVAATYIKDFHEENNLDTEYQKFSIRRMNAGPKNEKGDDFTQNIFAWIEGNDPVLKNEIIVIGAHMDHIGYGPSMSRSRRVDIHNGADDNASGTVALMEIAQAFSMLKGKVISHRSIT